MYIHFSDLGFNQINTILSELGNLKNLEKL